jgi:hypothetical protein
VTTATKILEVVAKLIDDLAPAAKDPAKRGAAEVAALAIRTVARLLEDRTPEQAIEVLERIRDHGAQPITRAELDDQVDKALGRTP